MEVKCDIKTDARQTIKQMQEVEYRVNSLMRSIERLKCMGIVLNISTNYEDKKKARFIDKLKNLWKKK